ncbi:MAG: Xaa-Pro peptidase family protein [Treponema sp.]|jgi:Xaa-Pro dipeptidase|nr:Xaa-Pro peptidase family protein [Treponema sp.]
MEKYTARLEKVWDWMAREGISLVMLEDSEGRRDNNIRWLTGHPNDALLFLSADRKALLAAWDINLAKLSARPPVMIAAYNDFDRNPRKAAAAIIKKMGISAGSKIEIPAVTPYPVFLDYVGDLTDFDVLCREKSAGGEIRKLRAVKDEDEINITRNAAQITNELIELLEENVRNGKIKTEADAALIIEVECRKRGCEGTSFGTLAAGTGRSFAIHAFPGWTFAPFAEKGLSILDFGVNLNGYSTDVTLTFARDLDSKQEIITDLVKKAYEKALSMAHNGTPARDIAAAVDKIFSKSKKSMPHGLGHGIGLDAHEYPVLRNSGENEWILEPGMIFTVEPGLYDQNIGGCRLENDVLITETGPEVLTNSRIVLL